MTKAEADALLGMIRGAWNMYLDEYGVTAWTDFLKTRDVEMATKAYLHLRDAQPERPVIADLRNMIVKFEVDRRMSLPAIEEPGFVREIDPWVFAWCVARYKHGDLRILPQQKSGYDALQGENPYYRTYVWPDQEHMDADAVAAYQAEGAGLTAADVFRLIG